MSLFNFHPAEWAMFFFIFSSLAIYTGAIGSYSEHAFTWGFGQVFEWPIQNVVIPVFNSPFALLTPFAAVAVIYLVFNVFAKTVDPAVVGGVIFGALVITLGA